MNYPTMEAVEAADKVTLGTWLRFLPGPGWGAAGTDAFATAIEREIAIMDRIIERFKELGGWDTAISKAIG